jgi:hypothetical protein
LFRKHQKLATLSSNNPLLTGKILEITLITPVSYCPDKDSFTQGNHKTAHVRANTKASKIALTIINHNIFV